MTNDIRNNPEHSALGELPHMSMPDMKSSLSATVTKASAVFKDIRKNLEFFTSKVSSLVGRMRARFSNKVAQMSEQERCQLGGAEIASGRYDPKKPAKKQCF